ncbi:MAG: acetolactate synthase small subunit [Candidatus Marinimicrobia bacterium]|jgi:acetolactate synthase-1/3 small subunit|nr:acetolactate synthase small subunit [Candidatus Neomarinimicrobiota bacterium]MBT3502601.1 acetolactate synthase small subunit [Candidatus Neomarinimicrobiota bacterium]MBT3839255.1 acetolactate synthase small subunit [Candidatus Neomarinimicrobiota bacterium]MBT3999216.1 acetolactate synthase small subunit [Candidatus Neomarinimicrobiota bacterium]MBT4281916.1 acetolactate synthase small subunit [Candidatus Neomarinimicrobiota bacterium]
MKQTLIVFVQDEPGVLNRISSHIRKRNFNIESLVAGKTEKKGITRMTVVLNEPDKTKQKIVVSSLSQLDDVYDVIDATKTDCHIREYALLKISVHKNDLDKIRKSVESLHNQIIDEKDNAVIIELTGSEKDVESAIQSFDAYDILEIVRSGKVAMVSGNFFENKPSLTKKEPNWATGQILDSF